MRIFFIWLLPLLLVSCNPPENKNVNIDLSQLEGAEITLSEIADDITYIPLDNDYPMSIYFQRIEVFNDTIYLSEKDNGVFA